MINRRRMVQTGLASSAAALAGCDRKQPSSAQPLQTAWKNWTDVQGFKTYIKTIGALDTRDVYVWFSGVLWGVLPRVATTPLCGFQGLARHRWRALEDGRYSQTAYDVGFFSDLETGLPAETIVNPLTGESVRPFHNSYGGFEQIHSLAAFAEGTNGQPAKKDHLHWTAANGQAVLTERMTGNVPSKMPPADWPRETSGPTNFYGGETSYSVPQTALTDERVKAAPYTLFWSSFAPWEPWLFMDGAKGACQWRATGMKLEHYDQAPDVMLDFVEKTQPDYFGENAPWDGYRSATDDFIKERGPTAL